MCCEVNARNQLGPRVWSKNQITGQGTEQEFFGAGFESARGCTEASVSDPEKECVCESEIPTIVL